MAAPGLANSEVFRGRFAPVFHLLITHLRAFVEAAQACLLNSYLIEADTLCPQTVYRNEKSIWKRTQQKAAPNGESVSFGWSIERLPSKR
jgi:hypothetical protein